MAATPFLAIGHERSGSVRAFEVPNLVLDLRFLGYAITAAEHRSFRRAAVALGLSQSTVSRRIKILEDRLGIILFRRHRFGVELTEQGARFLASAQIDAERLQRTAREVKLGRQAAPRELRLGVSDPLAGKILRHVLAKFRARHPEIFVEVEDASHEALLRRIDDGTLDIALVAGRLPSRGMRSLLLWEEKTLLALSRRHKLVRRSTIDWRDLVDDTFLIGDCETSREIEAYLVRCFAGVGSHPRIQVHKVRHAGILDLTALGVGITVTANSFVPIDTLQEIVLRPLPSSEPSIAPVAVWHPNNFSESLRIMLDVLKDGYGAKNGAGETPSS